MLLNLVIKISTNLSPQELLKVTQKVENDLGRKGKLGGDLGLSTLTFYYIIKKILKQRIIIPHPRMFERAFVIVPLLEINQDIKQNISRSQVEEMKRREGVTVWKQKNGEDAFVLFEN